MDITTREFPTTPLGIERAMVQGVLIDEAVEMLFEGTRHSLNL